MKRTIIVAIVVSLLLAILPVGLALADTTAEVTVTATPGSFVGISNSTGSLDFGEITASSTPDTSATPFTITNSSSVVIDITVGCDGWSGTEQWTYAAAGADTALLNASASDSDTGGSSGIGAFDKEVPSTGSILLIENLATGTNPTWNLQLEAPTSFSHGYTQTTTVTLTAAAS